MSKRGKHRPRGGFSDENLRGKLREVEKKNQQLLRSLNSLKKQISRENKSNYHYVPVEDIELKKPKTKDLCEKCKSDNITYINTFKVKEPILMKCCNDCGKSTVVRNG